MMNITLMEISLLRLEYLMPQVPENYEIKDNKFKRSLFTIYNNKIQTKRELVEILEK